MDIPNKASGPLRTAERLAAAGFIIVDENNLQVAFCSTWSVLDNEAKAEARAHWNKNNAERLVACWNACEGVETDTLRSIAGKDLFTKAIQASNQHDDLIAALESLVSACDTGERDTEGNPRGVQMPDKRDVARARAAIAKAKGGDS